MTEAIACATLLVREYDEAIEFFTRALGFRLPGARLHALAGALHRQPDRRSGAWPRARAAKAASLRVA